MCNIWDHGHGLSFDPLLGSDQNGSVDLMRNSQQLDYPLIWRSDCNGSVTFWEIENIWNTHCSVANLLDMDAVALITLNPSTQEEVAF